MLIPNYDAAKDYFAILGIHQQASEEVVKRAYRKMARRYHPDVSKIHRAKEKFQEIAEAYEVLSKHKVAYWKDFCQRQQSSSSKQKSSEKQNSDYYHQSKKSKWRPQQPINGKHRQITYPLTLRYAIRLLKIGHFYIPGLKVQMKFTREAFSGKTFRLKGKGYQGLFGGVAGDYLVSFELKMDVLKWELRGSDIYGTVKVPKMLLEPGHKLELDSPSGSMDVTVPHNYSSEHYIKVQNMGLPGDAKNFPGHLYARLVAS